jgi:transcriptional regulator with XRE-family HTH domain
MKNVAKKIKDLRKSQKITQEEMARLLEIGRSAYEKIENGKNEVLSRHIVKISEIFNVSTDWLLKGEKINTQSKQEGPDFNALGKYKEVVLLMVSDMIEDEYLLHSMCRFYFQCKAREYIDEEEKAGIRS